MARPLRLATRGSPLALRQAETVSAALAGADGGGPEVELVVVQTAGDLQRDRPIAEISGQGVFVNALEQALCDDRADLAVHSAKDLPSSFGVDGLGIVAVPERGDPRDALVGRDLDELGPGAHVATGAARRRAQLAWLRPDLRFVELRGNIATRLAKVPAEGAVVIAYAALRAARPDRPRAGVLSALDDAAPGRPGRPRRAVQAGRRSAPARWSARSTTPAPTVASTPSGPSSPSSAAAASYPWAPTPRPDRMGPWSCKGLIASLDGLVLLRARLSGRDGSRWAGRSPARSSTTAGEPQVLSGAAGSRERPGTDPARSRAGA